NCIVIDSLKIHPVGYWNLNPMLFISVKLKIQWIVYSEFFRENRRIDTGINLISNYEVFA
ncbi:MAG: hypothetical protein EBX50_19505, partial [Chitinophagia bacterium]|nr:hypothetical protein [Chitinophagia bacterium]